METSERLLTHAYNDHNVYILGARFSAVAGLPLITVIQFRSRLPFVYPLRTLLKWRRRKWGLSICVRPGLEDRFIQPCQLQDQSDAQVLRDFMRRYLEEYSLLGKPHVQYSRSECIRKRKVGGDYSSQCAGRYVLASHGYADYYREKHLYV